MIHHIQGTITGVDQGMITVDVAGIGLAVQVTRPEQYTVAQTTKLTTYFHWNQETGPQIFGFGSAVERQAFILMIGCSGIGPKVALSILSQITAQEFFTSITLAQTQTLSSLKGIGQKKAESLIMQLQDKVAKLTQTMPAMQDKNPLLSHIKNLTDVLVSLHYSKPEIGLALEHIKHTASAETAAFDDLLRRSLTFLAKNKHAL